MRQISVLLASALILISCSNGYRSPKGKGGGVIDGGGGGDFVYHSQESVLQMIDETWTLLVSESLANPLLHAYGLSSKVAQPTRAQKIAHQVLFRIAMGRDDAEHHFDMETAREQARLFRNKKLRLEMNGLCAGPYDQKYLASVNRLDMAGDICISVFGLMRLPSGGLKTDLIGLLIHEAAHLQGFDEEHARTAQRFVMENINTILLQNHEEARYLYLNQAWNEKFGLWPLLLNYGEIDRSYAEKTGYLLYLMQSFREEFKDETHILRSAAKKDTKALVEDSLNTFLSDLEAYAIEIQKESEKPGQKITESHLIRIRTISNMMVNTYNQLRYFLFAHRVPFEDIAGIPILPYGPRLLRILDTTLIWDATEPDALSNESKRLEDLICRSNTIERRSHEVLERIYTAATRLSFIRCHLSTPIREKYRSQVDEISPPLKRRYRAPEFTNEPAPLPDSMR